jgi:hypothetical protein
MLEEKATSTLKKRVVRAKISSPEQYIHDLNYFKNKYPILTTRSTGYSYRFVTPEIDYVFQQSNLSSKVFGVFNKVKAEVKKHSELYKVPELTAKDVIYFRFDAIERYKPDMYLIDITAAYPTTALLLGYISKETYNKTMQLDKLERLRIFGMLAKSEIIVNYKAGEVQDIINIRAEFSRYFFSLCKEVGKIMSELYNKYSSSCLFWVDGIYCTDYFEAQKIASDLMELNYQVKIELLNNCQLSKNKTIFVYHKRENKKILCLPKKYKVINPVAYQFLNS